MKNKKRLKNLVKCQGLTLILLILLIILLIIIVHTAYAVGSSWVQNMIDNFEHGTLSTKTASISATTFNFPPQNWIGVRGNIRMGSEAPVWAATGVTPVPDIGADARPAAADLDNDGDYDLIVGESTAGVIDGIVNTGTATAPAWSSTLNNFNVGQITTLGAQSAPCLVDLDNDGDYDLLIGDTTGVSFAYENTGTISAPSWTAKSGWNVPDIGASASPAAADLDNDGDYDLMIGSTLGIVYGYRNDSGRAAGATITWTAVTGWNTVDIGADSGPALADLDGDGDYDLMIGEDATTGRALGYSNDTGKTAGETITWTAVAGWNTADYGSEIQACLVQIYDGRDFDLILGITGGTSPICKNNDAGSTNSGTFTSSVLDTGVCAQAVIWGTISWTATDSGTGASISFATRTGPTATYDASWSSWSSEYTTSGSSITSPSNRYIQYRATFTTTTATSTKILDDVTITYNRLPSAPTLSSPSNGASTCDTTPTFTWNNSTDCDNDPRTYQIQVDNEDTFSVPININVSGITEGGAGTTSYTDATPLADGTYYWRVRANDGTANGDWSSPTWSFTTMPVATTVTVGLTDTSISFAQGTKEDLIKIVVSGANGCIEIKSFSFTFKDAGGADLLGSDLDDLASNLYVYLDDNASGIYEEATDITAVTSLAAALFNLTSATQILSTTNDDASIILGIGDSKTYFLVVQLTAGATSATKKAFYVTHTPATQISVKSPPTTEANPVTPTGSSLTTNTVKAAYWRDLIGSTSTSWKGGQIRGGYLYVTKADTLYAININDGITNNVSVTVGSQTFTQPITKGEIAEDSPDTDDCSLACIYVGSSNGGLYAYRHTTTPSIVPKSLWGTNPVTVDGSNSTGPPTLRYITESGETFLRVYVGCGSTGATPNEPDLHAYNSTNGTNCQTSGNCGSSTWTLQNFAANVAIDDFPKAGTTYNYISSDDVIYRVNATTGDNLTSATLSGTIMSYPYIDTRQSPLALYIGAGNTTLHKRDGVTANLPNYTGWTDFSPAGVGDVSNAPFVPYNAPDNNKVYVGYTGAGTGGVVYALNKNTGGSSSDWSTNPFNMGGTGQDDMKTQPLFIEVNKGATGNPLAILGGDGYLYLLNASNGSLIDKAYIGKTAVSQNCTPIQVPGYNKVIVGSTNGYIFCFPVP